MTSEKEGTETQELEEGSLTTKCKIQIAELLSKLSLALLWGVGYPRNIHPDYYMIFLRIVQIASASLTDSHTSPARHLGKQINYKMKFLVSKGERQ